MPTPHYNQQEIDALFSDMNVQAIKQALVDQSTKIALLEAKVSTLMAGPLPPPPTVTSKTKVYLPLFMYPSPDDGNYQTIFDLKAMYPNVDIVYTLNPQSGHFSSVDTSLLRIANKLKAAGITVAGYVATGYGDVALSKVKTEISNYKKFYSTAVSAIFFDEFRYNDASAVQYYKDAVSHVKAEFGAGAYTIGNPGAYNSALLNYLGIVNCLLIYESEELPTIATLQRRTSNTVDRSNFGMIPHSVKSAPTDQYIKDACKEVGLIYITNDTMKNPWDSISIYLPQLMKVVSSL